MNDLTPQVPGEPPATAGAEKPKRAPRRQPADAEQKATALQDHDKVDPKKIKRPVLTKQGWVCPEPPEKER